MSEEKIIIKEVLIKKGSDTETNVDDQEISADIGVKSIDYVEGLREALDDTSMYWKKF